MTPIYYRLENRLDREFKILDREKITHWLFHFNGEGVDIDNCRGGRIRIGGAMEFADQPRHIYWTFITPCLHDIILDVLNEADEQGRRYAPDIAREALDEASELLKSFVARVYNQMVVIDRRLRGKGYPDSVDPYDASEKIKALQAHVDERAASMRAQIAVPTWLQKRSAALERHRVLVSIVLALASAALGWLIRDLQGPPIR